MWKPALLLILPLYPMMNFASDQHEHEGGRSSLEGGCETIGGTFWAHSLHYNNRLNLSLGDKCVFPFTYQVLDTDTHTWSLYNEGSDVFFLHRRWLRQRSPVVRSAGRIYSTFLRNYEENPQVRADASRTVLRGKWEDCSPECPGYDLSGKEIIH